METKDLSPAMSAFCEFSTVVRSSSFKLFPYLLSKSPHQIQTLSFCNLKPLQTFKSSSNLRTFYKFPKSNFPVESQLSDEDDEEEEEEELDDDDDDEDDDDDHIAAEEYDVISGEVSGEVEEEESESLDDEVSEDKIVKYEEFKWQRVQRLCNEVREFGEEILDVNELASVYSFRIDKFQVFLSPTNLREVLRFFGCDLVF